MPNTKVQAKLKDVVGLIEPQPDTTLRIQKVSSGEVLWTGPAHYLTGNESFCDTKIKSISLQNQCYVFKV